MLKDKEIQIIKETVKTIKGRDRMVGNAITLVANDEVTLRTNGDVVYGLYKNTLHGEKYVKFSHAPHYKKPYIDSEYYMDYKDIVNETWNKYFYQGSEARTKYNEVLKVIAGSTANEPVVIKEEKIEEPIIKEEVTMKSTNVMSLAHQLRKEMNLEGHYHVQMKIAMKMAWMQIKSNKVVAPVVVPAPVIQEPIEPASAPKVNSEYDYIFAPIKVEDNTYTYALKDKNGVIYGNTFVYSGRTIAVADMCMKAQFKRLIANFKPNTKVVLLGKGCLTLSKVDQAIIKAIKEKNIKLSLDIDAWMNPMAPSGDVI